MVLGAPDSISEEDSLSEIALSGASKLASAYFTLFYRSVHVLYTGMHIMHAVCVQQSLPSLVKCLPCGSVEENLYFTMSSSHTKSHCSHILISNNIYMVGKQDKSTFKKQKMLIYWTWFWVIIHLYVSFITYKLAMLCSTVRIIPKSIVEIVSLSKLMKKTVSAMGRLDSIWKWRLRNLLMCRWLLLISLNYCPEEISFHHILGGGINHLLMKGNAIFV